MYIPFEYAVFPYLIGALGIIGSIVRGVKKVFGGKGKEDVSRALDAAMGRKQERAKTVQKAAVPDQKPVRGSVPRPRARITGGSARAKLREQSKRAQRRRVGR